MDMRTVNPWTWQEDFGYSQAIEVTGGERVLYCAGQTSVDENGAPLHPGDMVAQAAKAMDNLEAVLEKAGMTLANLVRMNFYTTDVDAFFGASAELIPRMNGHLVPGTLLGVSRLAFPELMIEIEATAVA